MLARPNCLQRSFALLSGKLANPIKGRADASALANGTIGTGVRVQNGRAAFFPSSFARGMKKKAEGRVAGSTLEAIDPSRIRNFSVIAHIDHGKSTLSDRLLQHGGTIQSGTRAQYLDKLQVERERGITIKAQTATIILDREDGKYMINLIDTPGHVDFSYEVSRSLKACQGVVLVVDASQGVQAQTVATFYAAFEAGLEIVPVANKIDLPHANVEAVKDQLGNVFGIEGNDVIAMSAKQGIGVPELMEAIINKLPCPDVGSRSDNLRALLFDFWFDDYKGVVCLVSVFDGVLKAGMRITAAHKGKTFDVQEVGIMFPEAVNTGVLYPGQVGYIICGIRNVDDAQVGDTIYEAGKQVAAFDGFRPAKPMVFAGVYAMHGGDFDRLRAAIERLTVNDSSVTVQKESSTALGLGFRCGFLGLLHMDVFKQRLEQEYGTDAIVTNPTVPYKATLKNGKEITVSNPSDLPDSGEIESLYEPFVNATIICPTQYMGGIMELCKNRRGQHTKMSSLDHQTVMLEYSLPLAEITSDFYDVIKSKSSGFASMDYEDAGYQSAPLKRLVIMLNGKPVDALSTVVHRDSAQSVGRALVTKLKSVMARQQFEVAIQAAVDNKVIARETVKAVRKNVLVKGGKTMGGGDITRKQKLLAKQKAGKKAMKKVGNVELSQEAFYAVMKRED